MFNGEKNSSHVDSNRQTFLNKDNSGCNNHYTMASCYQDFDKIVNRSLIIFILYINYFSSNLY